MNNSFKDLDINARTVEALHKANIHGFENVLKLSLPELVKQARLSETEALNLTNAVSRELLNSRIVRASELHSIDNPLRRRLSFSCPRLDVLLEGGLATKSVTEITGESGVGKTQLCLQLAIRAQLPFNKGGLDSGVVYLCTEDAFPIKRMKQMIGMFVRENPTYRNRTFTDTIHISHISNVMQMLLCLRRDVPSLLKKNNLKLVVIDSIAAIIRGEYDFKDSLQRNRDLQSLAYEVWKLAHHNNVCVICVNQVTGCGMPRNGQENDLGLGTSVPSLGLLWSSVLNSRIMLFKTFHSVQQNKIITSVRKLKVIFSPYLPTVSCHYVITEHGVMGIDWTE